MSKTPLSLKDVDLNGKKVFMRVDFNVPLRGDTITDTTRIDAALPSIQAILDQGAALVLASHLGRPKGEVVAKDSLKPVAAYLESVLEAPMTMATDCVDDAVQQAKHALQPGEVLLLENVRFHAEEETNDPAFAKALAEGMDVYVNDAFGSSHRAHASVAGIAAHIDVKVAGLLLEKELAFLANAIEHPTSPFVAILGGAKVSDKIGVIEALLDKVDCLIVGGGMAYTFYRAMGLSIGTSIVEEDKIELAKSLLDKASTKGVELLLPEDNVIASAFSADAEIQTVLRDSIPDQWMGLDIGPLSQALFAEKVKRAKTVLWNGPMGVFELEPFAKGTLAVAQALVEATEAGATTIIGGGDSAAAITQLGLESSVSHVSTGGGASLELLEGKELPGVSALMQ
ncbi:MAG: phosphoglycerate kinase [Rhodothermaceae bacterium TMED105]|nr:MAG: phosphoglycerate kinase [Rhodothermaceae bacterium TMED105]|tara:strand:+ start:3971 stop:5167 length:1197 start_codon:yes stop_codon:yes gene_type:complete